MIGLGKCNQAVVIVDRHDKIRKQCSADHAAMILEGDRQGRRYDRVGVFEDNVADADLHFLSNLCRHRPLPLSRATDLGLSSFGQVQIDVF